MSELKPCPFCGGEAEMERPGTRRQSMQVACTNCGARVESGDVTGLTKPENYKWNGRDDRQLSALQKVVKAHAADLRRCAKVIRCSSMVGHLAKTAIEFEAAATELEEAAT